MDRTIGRLVSPVFCTCDLRPLTLVAAYRRPRTRCSSRTPLFIKQYLNIDSSSMYYNSVIINYRSQTPHLIKPLEKKIDTGALIIIRLKNSGKQK